MRWF